MVGAVEKTCFAGIAFIITAMLLSPRIQPNGELGVWYAVSTCFDAEASIAVDGRGTFDAYSMRPVLPSALPGNACPTLPTVSPPITITLETADGYRSGDSSYRPIFLMPSGTYASITFEVADAEGAVIMPLQSFALGPDEAHPWAAPSPNISAADALLRDAYSPLFNMTNVSLANGTICSDSCRYGSDGTCDDGGAGAEFAHCDFASDCADCGERKLGRRLAARNAPAVPLDMIEATNHELAVSRMGSVGGAGGLGTDGTSVAGAVVGHAHEQPPAPGSRRLLKGASGSLGGRSAAIGSSRWGVASPTTRVGGSSVTTSRNGLIYGGAAMYSVRGRSYGAGKTNHTYEYFAARDVYTQHAAVWIVGSSSYGCYSCSGAARTCQACAGDCTRRVDCAGIRVTDVAFTQDRYELSTTLRLPGPGARWPLYLTVHNATQFASRGALASSGSDVYMSFYTEDGNIYKSIADALYALGFMALLLAFIMCQVGGPSRERAPRAPKRDRVAEARREWAASEPGSHSRRQLHRV